MKPDFMLNVHMSILKDDIKGFTWAEKGVYLELIIMQFDRNERVGNGRFSENEVKKLLGKRFDEYWPRVKSAFRYYEGFYFIEWEDISLWNRKKYKTGRKANAEGIKAIMDEIERDSSGIKK
jgi:hypothetical protein